MILISFNIWFEYYLRISLEKEFNKSLNATVSIGNVDMKFLSGQIVIEDFVLVGKSEFSKDTLIYCGSIIAEPGDFDSETLTLNFKRLITDNITVKTIVSKSGVTSWDNLILEQDSVNTDSSQQTKLFLEKIVITDGLLEYEDRSNKTFYSLRNLDLVMSFSEDSAISTADYNLNASFFKDSVSILDFRVSGNLKSTDAKTDIEANLTLGKIPVKINAIIPNDSLKNSLTKVEAIAEFNDLWFENAFSSGLLKLNLDFSESFNNVQVKFEADSLELSKPDSTSMFFADFNLSANYKNADKLNLSYELKNCLISTNNSDTLKGNYKLNFSDSTLNIFSDLNGKLNLNIPFSAFGDYDGSLFFHTELNSDLKYYCNSETEESEGQIIHNLKFLCPFFKISKSEFLFEENKSISVLRIDSDFLNADLSLMVQDFQDYFANGTIKSNLIIDVNHLKIPTGRNGNYNSLQNNQLQKKDPKLIFPDFFELDLLINVDTLSFDSYHIYNFVNHIVVAPKLMMIESEKAEIGTSTIEYKYKIGIDESDTVYYALFRLSPFDLSYFSKKDRVISGLLEIDSENTFYSNKSSKQNSGKNRVSIKEFKMPLSLFKEYGIDEDNLVISDFDLIADLYSDSLKIQAFKLNVNKLETSISGSYNYSKDNLSLSFLIDAPESYLSPEIKIALSMFSEKSAVKLPKKMGRIIRHLKITGSITKPQFILFE